MTWRCRIETVKPGATASTRAIDPIGVRVELGLVWLDRVRVRHPLREHRHHVLALGRERGVEHARDADVGERAARRPGPRPRPGTRPRCRRATPRARSCRRAPRDRSPGLAVNSGSRSTATFTFTVPLRERQRFDALDEVGRAAAPGRRVRRNVIFGWVAATTTSARSSSPDSSVTPRTRPLRTSMRATAASVRTVAPFGDGGVAQRPADRAHAALGESPRAELALADVADLVVRHDVRGPGRPRPGPRADHAADREHALHLRRREVLVEQVGDAHREQAGDVGGRRRRRARAASTRAAAARRGRAAGATRRAAGSSSAAGRARRRGCRATSPSARTRRRRPWRTARSRRAGARGRRRGVAARGRRGTARSSRSAGTPCSRASVELELAARSSAA